MSEPKLVDRRAEHDDTAMNGYVCTPDCPACQQSQFDDLACEDCGSTNIVAENPSRSSGTYPVCGDCRSGNVGRESPLPTRELADRLVHAISDAYDAGSDYNTGEKCPHDRYGYEDCEACMMIRAAKAVRKALKHG